MRFLLGVPLLDDLAVLVQNLDVRAFQLLAVIRHVHLADLDSGDRIFHQQHRVPILVLRAASGAYDLSVITDHEGRVTGNRVSIRRHSLAQRVLLARLQAFDHMRFLLGVPLFNDLAVLVQNLDVCALQLLAVVSHVHLADLDGGLILVGYGDFRGLILHNRRLPVLNAVGRFFEHEVRQAQLIRADLNNRVFTRCQVVQRHNAVRHLRIGEFLLVILRSGHLEGNAFLLLFRQILRADSFEALCDLQCTFIFRVAVLECNTALSCSADFHFAARISLLVHVLCCTNRRCTRIPGLVHACCSFRHCVRRVRQNTLFLRQRDGIRSLRESFGVCHFYSLAEIRPRHNEFNCHLCQRAVIHCHRLRDFQFCLLIRVRYINCSSGYCCYHCSAGYCCFCCSA